MRDLRVIAYGGGVQSTALLVLAAGVVPTYPRIDYRTFLFSNVGDDSEDPKTLQYVKHFAAPFAEEHGIELHWLRRIKRDGSTETLYGRLMRDGSRSLPIPVRMPETGAPGTRSCTADFKIRVIGQWLKQHGASPDTPATVGMGISADEAHRINARKVEPYEKLTYPLVQDFTPPLRRDDCIGIIAQAGLPVPPKSACWFCPFHRPQMWAEMRRDRPELFEKACHLENTLNERRDQLGRDHVYLTRFGKPLSEAVAVAQEMLPLLDDNGCDNGWCMT